MINRSTGLWRLLRPSVCISKKNSHSQNQVTSSLQTMEVSSGSHGKRQAFVLSFLFHVCLSEMAKPFRGATILYQNLFYFFFFCIFFSSTDQNTLLFFFYLVVNNWQVLCVVPDIYMITLYNISKRKYIYIYINISI